MLFTRPPQIHPWRRFLALPLACALAPVSVLAGYASGVLLPEPPPAQASLANAAPAPSEVGGGEAGEAADPLGDYRDAMTLLRARHFGPEITPGRARSLTYEAIRGMLDSLNDPFSSFLDPEEWAQMQSTTRGDFEGIGAFLQSDPDSRAVRVIEPIETGPAERAGVRAGDIITKVDGRTVLGLELHEVAALVKGGRGTRMRLEVRRGGQTLAFPLTRERVEPPVVKHWMEDERAGIGRILLKEFNEKSVEQLERALADLKRRGMRALVFDLRNNPGGLLETAIEVASVLVSADLGRDAGGAAVFIREGGGEARPRLLRQGAYRLAGIPLAVLANSSSASASEIVTGAVKDHAAGSVVGERTYGKGKVQTLFPLDDGSALRLTTAVYFPPRRYDINFRHDDEGRRIPGTGGILPDVEVKPLEGWGGPGDRRRDAQLTRALELLRARLDAPVTGSPRAAVRRSH